MNEDRQANSERLMSPRSIGTGLTRINLSSGITKDAKLLKRGVGLSRDGGGLTTPSRVVISGSSLAPRRTPSDRYQSAYQSGLSRLGGSRNVSDPNFSSSSFGKYDRSKKSLNDTDINQNTLSTPLRRNTPLITSKLRGDADLSNLSKNVSVGVDIKSTDSAVRKCGLPYERVEVKKTFDNESGVISKSATDSNESSKNEGFQTKGLSNLYPEKVQKNVKANCDINLEDFEEDAIDAKVVTSRQSGDRFKKSFQDTIVEEQKEENLYTSPKKVFDNNVLSTSVKQTLKVDLSLRMSRPQDKQDSIDKQESRLKDKQGSVSQEMKDRRSQVKQGSRSVEGQKTLDITKDSVPQRPARTKSLSRKQSGDFGKTELQVSPRGVGNLENTDHNSNTVRKLISATLHTANDKIFSDDTEKASEKVDVTPVPKARLRVHRKLTKKDVGFKHVEEDEYIGFASLPEQAHRKALRRGFNFTLMVVGETGLGKSTLINSLFLMDLYKDRVVGNIEERIEKTIEIERKELEIEERGVKLKLTIVDTPGFNDAINSSWKEVVEYLDGQFDAYLQAESGLNRKNIQDRRVHCCLYFIPPYGHGLKQSDVIIMKKMHHKVNIIPLIAKADMLTRSELKKMKVRILSDIEQHHIEIYQYPDCDSDEDEEFKQQDAELKNSIPFAVVGSNTVVEAGGKKIRGRMYPWGIVEVENPLHSDFCKLRQMLISTHMQDLKDVTCDIHYENYRAEQILELMSLSQRERAKLKRDSVANMEVSMDTDKLLLEKEAEIQRMEEMLVRMQAQKSQNSPRSNGALTKV